MDRRGFIKGAAAGAAGLGALGARATGAKAGIVESLLQAAGLGRASRTPVEHIVVLMQENRSVDHLLGWYGAENPEFDAIQNATYTDLRQGPGGPPIATENWGRRGRNSLHGRGYRDPSHGWAGGRHERNGGACDGWLDPRTGNDEYTLSYYEPQDTPVWTRLTRQYQTYDRWFCSVLGPTYPNRYYLHSAQSGGMKGNDFPPQRAGDNPAWAVGWDWPTIWTLLENANITCGYYFSNFPVVGLWGARHLRHMRHISQYYADAALGTLPQVSFLDPWFVFPEGLANDDHPHADLRLGQSFISDVVEAFVKSPVYRKGALVITYDEWGGFWDHVDPPRVADDRATDANPGGDDDFAQCGFRVPSTVVSPWTRGNAVDHTVYDHASVIKFISDNWGLPYLTKRHAGTNSIEGAFRGFTRYNPEQWWEPYQAPLDLVLEPALEAPGDTVLDGINTVVGGLGSVLGLDLPRVDAPAAAAAPAPAAAPGAAPVASDMYHLAETGWFDKFKIKTDWRFEDGFLHDRRDLIDVVKKGYGRLTSGAK